jgi:polyphosphate kinase 2 (PPK2 family)
MDFCSKEQTEAFLESVVPLETMLVRDGMEIRKYYLDITRKEQKKRLKAREDSPLKQWKISPVDAAAQKKWADYSKWRDITLERTSHPAAPWHVVASDTKKTARLEFLRDLLSGFDYPGKSKKLTHPDRNVAFVWKPGDQKKLAH